jgi:hypothetical protein
VKGRGGRSETCGRCQRECSERTCNRSTDRVVLFFSLSNLLHHPLFGGLIHASRISIPTEAGQKVWFVQNDQHFRLQGGQTRPYLPALPTTNHGQLFQLQTMASSSITNHRQLFQLQTGQHSIVVRSGQHVVGWFRCSRWLG